LRRYTAAGASSTPNKLLAVPVQWTAFGIGAASDSRVVVTGQDMQGLWFSQRYTSADNLDPTYGGLGYGRPDIEGPNQRSTGDSAVLPDGSVVFATTREFVASGRHDMVFVKLQGGEGNPASVALNGKGTLIVTGTGGDDAITLSIRSRDGRFIARADDFAKSFAPSRVKRIAVFAGGGADSVSVAPGVRGAYLDGGDGDDTLTGGDNADILIGGFGDDLLAGGLAPDRILGDDGNDVIYGNGGKDYLLGGAGKDDLFGNGMDDTLNGAGGNDRLYGGGGADLLIGGDGADAAAYDLADSRSADIEAVLT
jgi:Ca2+-binding RTX toxin-like protein